MLDAPNKPIAIIGSACRFAGDATSPSKLWKLLQSPRDVRSEIPQTRFRAKSFYNPDEAYHGHSNVIHSYLIEDDISAFDAGFFGIKPSEAHAADPQQRVLMEVVYEALEASGLTIKSLKASDTGVFVGAMCADYEALQLRDLDDIPTYFATGSARSILSNRISYYFDWRGPSMTIDTACSSSLVAMHLAVNALRSGESRIVVVCGSNLILGPDSYIMESKLKMLSPDGLGRMWDKAANGYARGDGVAAIVLKTLDSAIADGDDIECVLRETGVNQDGATPGITMPSASSQQALIESTYVKAGLDLNRTTDRPQVFEAHGTGTPAGDPTEAEAISKAFFGQDKRVFHEDDSLYIGSIKTVLGHTEGTAGVAAVLKALLAIRHGQIPPNLHFKDLSPAVAPFYQHLEIPTSAQAWPEVPGAPRRVSVNSFGFGGTNAHAILESYDPLTSTNTPKIPPSACSSLRPFTPYVFSAMSERSLKANLQAYVANLDELATATRDASDLAYTLRKHRSIFPYRASFSSRTIRDLKTDIQASLEDATSTFGIRAQARSGMDSNAPKILGVFTGQGAQYPRMGASLIEESLLAGQIVENLESYLSQLPEADRPSWSLKSELLASSSRVHEASISQPLCTAIQIFLVDLLRTANVQFDVVIGHSSGEIAAAYAAGYLTARDAIVIAFYRGLHCRQAASLNGDIKGAMLAVGTSMNDATELCQDEWFAGRVCVAACNSPSSVTISGDEDAIEQLAVILDDEKKFNRRLRVDQAYHSSHMLPCSDPYIESLRRANIKPQIPPAPARCYWYSSVHGGSLISPADKLDSVYWAENQTSPVLFSQALSTALSDYGVFDLVLEVGAHPALKGPSSETIQHSLNQNIPYHGCLRRGTDAVAAMSSCLGFLWSHLDKNSIDLNDYEIAVSGSGNNSFKLLKGLPSYQWDHETKYWHESRRSKRMRLRKPSVPLLGDESPESAPHHLRWKNFLIPRELPWLEGHQVQGQIVFPAAGYVSTALEAARQLAAGQEIRLIQISAFQIHQAITFDEDTSAVEILIELSNITEDRPDALHSKFAYSAVIGGRDSDFRLVADGTVRVILDTASPDVLPKRAPATPHLIDVDPNRLYGFMESLGYNFRAQFRSLNKLRRKLGEASCEITSVPPINSGNGSPTLLHPAEIDAAFQTIMLAYSYPGDDRLRNLHLPARLATIRVNPALCIANRGQANRLSADSRLDHAKPVTGFSGHVNMYTPGCDSAALQVEGLEFVPFAGATNEDRNVFYKMEWVHAAPDGASAAEGIPVTQEDTELLWVLSRIASFFLRRFDEDVPEDSPARKEVPLCHYLNYARHMTDLFRSGKHKYAKTEWLTDTFEDVLLTIQKHGISGNADVKIMLLVGETMPRVFKQETTMIEHMRTSGLLDEYYIHGFGTMQSSLWLGKAVKEITDRHPHLSILEIGAGTGGATKNILKAIDQDFDNYTFTDISSSFFENAAEIFALWGDRMVFKVYDAERDPTTQGFEEGKYDVIVASLVIHATAELAKTLRNLRKLLRPGGYLVVGEGTSDGPLQSGDGFIFGALPGWWLGVDEGRTISPFVNVNQWDDLLKRTGFSGIDTLAPPKFLETFGIVLFLSQAVDEKISYLRHPLAVTQTAVPGTKIAKLAIIGGATEPVAKLAHEVGSVLANFSIQTVSYKSLEDIDLSIVDEESTVISLVELDAPSFKDMTRPKWQSFKRMFGAGKKLLWITTGRLADMPWSNMVVGFGRTAANETPGLHVQFLDLDTANSNHVWTISESLLRLHTTGLGAEGSGNILWTPEPEIVVDSEGRHLVPRLKQISAANNRYNSIQRPIFKDIDLETTMLELQQSSTGCKVTDPLDFDIVGNKGPETWRLRTAFTVLSALKTDIGHQFLASCSDSNGHHYLALVPRTLTAVGSPKESAIPYNLEGLDLSLVDFLSAAAAHLIALNITDCLFPGQTIALHNASPLIAQAVEIQAAQKTITVFCSIDSVNNLSAPKSWTRIPAYTGRADLFEMLPRNIACFVGFSTEDTENENTILSVLRPHCRRETASTIYCLNGLDAGPESAHIHAHALKQAIQFVVENHNSMIRGSGETISLTSLIAGERPKNPITIVDWTAQKSLPMQVTRLDTGPMFKGDKTYWLCGMSGALGISVCDWMIDRGTKHLVITSRNPKVEQSWLDEHNRNGVDVRIMSCDVTDEKALRAVHEKIVQIMPPIVGALNGAMVLRDSSIPNMDYDQVMDVIRPKVLGSIHLDQIFYNVDLDWFILISSINCIIGNVGQANYAAANTFMCSLAANRRKRGLNAVAVNGGAIIGAGYITRETDRALDITVQKMALMHLSEVDFHQIIAEATEASRLDSSISVSEITTGLLDISPDSANIPKWYWNPKFARFFVHQTANSENKTENTAMASISDQLQTCKTEQDLSLLIEQSFAAQLRKILQTPDGVSNEEVLSKRGPELGLDSLVSVDIRSWFLKNFQVQIPVLKIMGDSTMAGILKSAIKDVPAESLPEMNVARAGEPKADVKIVVNGVNGVSNGVSNSLESSSSRLIDWEEEAAPPEDFSSLQLGHGSTPNVPPMVIVLTGVTGLLGHHILEYLLKNTSAQKIHCLAVRILKERLKNKELLVNPRVQYHEGKLSDPYLGLSKADATSIFTEVDAVIHNGADTSHIKNYADVRASNVGSTIALTRLCLPRRIPMHYISSAGIAIYYGRDSFPAVSVTRSGSMYPAADGSFGYGCSKWACERILEQVHEKFDLPVYIYRPSTIIREGADTSTSRAQLDWVNALLHYIRKIQAAPKVEHNHGALDLVSIKNCCTELLENVSGKQAGKSLKYMNQVGDTVIPMDRMHEIDADQGIWYNVLPLSEWIEKAIAAGLHPAVGMLIKDMDSEGSPNYPRLLKGIA
ncbi:hypothetical protein N0V90_010003 [Kalmusia sp. IMI 367209]|nr:hypothetical protein N0V90_010003 [Kalmusia sp. IMI 367209]